MKQIDFFVAMPLLFLFLNGCVGISQEDLVLVEELQESSSFYGTSAEWKCRQVATPKNQILRHDLMNQKSGTNAQIRKELRTLRDEILLGKNFQKSSPVEIPRLEIEPVIDGDGSDWFGLELKEEYLLNSATPSGEALWKMAYDSKYLYFSALFRDADIQVNQLEPYQADSLELFLLTDTRLASYCEIVVSPRGDSYFRWGVVQRTGEIYVKPFTPCDVQIKAICSSQQYSIEGKISFLNFPGYLKGNPPRSGEIIKFMMVRTNLDGDSYSRTTPVPFLYDGHNTYGYMTAILK